MATLLAYLLKVYGATSFKTAPLYCHPNLSYSLDHSSQTYLDTAPSAMANAAQRSRTTPTHLLVTESMLLTDNDYHAQKQLRFKD